jgi:hypothetical protein
MAPASDLDRSHNSRSIDAADHFLDTLDAQGTSLTARLRFNKAEGDTPDVRDESNQLIDFRLRLRSSANAIRSGEQQRGDGSEKLAHEIERGVFAWMLRAGPRSAASSARGP